MIADRVFTKKVKGVTHKVLEGKEIPKGFFTEEEMKDLESKKIIFKDKKAMEDFKKPKETKKGSVK